MSDETVKYRVFKTNIYDVHGVKRHHDEEIELDPKVARRFNKLGFLRPLIEEEVDEPDDEDDDDEPIPQPNRRVAKPVG